MRLLRTSLAAAGLAGLGLAGAPCALATTYDFVPAPQTDLNRIYRIDRVTGEVSSCQYGLQEGTIGVTLCFGSGEGAGPQPPGEYARAPPRHEARPASSGPICGPARSASATCSRTRSCARLGGARPQ